MRRKESPYRGRTRPKSGVVRVPVFADGDLLALAVTGLELELTRDSDGAGGGVRGQLQGAVPPTCDVRHAAFAALLQMIAAHPADHADIIYQLDTNHDGVITFDEFSKSPIIEALLAPDVRLFDDAGRWAPRGGTAGADSLSLGIAFHARPCAAGCCR